MLSQKVKIFENRSAFGKITGKIRRPIVARFCATCVMSSYNVQEILNILWPLWHAQARQLRYERNALGKLIYRPYAVWYGRTINHNVSCYTENKRTRNNSTRSSQKPTSRTFLWYGNLVFTYDSASDRLPRASWRRNRHIRLYRAAVRLFTTDDVSFIALTTFN